MRTSTAGPTRSTRPSDSRRRPADRLVAAAQRRLALTTLALLVVLLAAVGITTAILADRSLNAAVDRTLESAALAELDRLHETGAEATAQPEASGSGGESEGDTPSASLALPQQTQNSPTSDSDDHAPAAADTFFLYLDASGQVLANPERILLVGLPNADAAVAATLAGRDLRTIRAGDVAVRLFTLPVPSEDDVSGQIRTLQAGFVLTLHDEQSDTLLRSILMVGLAGLLGAAVVSVILTRRALVPVRAAFDRERRFVAAASHELRTPVAVIRSSAEVLAREDKVRDEGRDLVADIVAEADRLAGLVAELSDLAVAQAGPTAAATPVDLDALADEIVRRAGPMAQDRGVTLEKVARSASPPIVVRADRDRVVQLVLILIDNAIRHTPRSGTVRVQVAAGSVRFGDLSVTDQGPGVPAVERERIFEPFARLSTSERGDTPSSGAPAGAGAGLGLAIARSLAEAMGGVIAVDDAPIRGSVFTVSLPRV